MENKSQHILGYSAHANKEDMDLWEQNHRHNSQFCARAFCSPANWNVVIFIHH